MVDFASDAAFAIDSRCHVAAWNRKAEHLLGYSKDEVIGRPCRGILQAVLPGGEPLCGPRCEPSRFFRSCLPRGVPSCRILRKDGDWVTVGYSSLVTSETARGSREGAVMAMIFLHDREQESAAAESQDMLQIYTLGNFGLAVGGQSVALDKWIRKQAVTLLKYLITQAGRPIHRERILACLWPDADESRGWERLKVTISYLRRQMRELGMRDDVVATVGKAYLLRRDAIRVDAETFERLIAEGRSLQAEQRNEEALACYAEAEHLYRGDYLEEDIFADWCAEERERLRELYLEMLADVIECCAQHGDYAEAARLCRKALVREPCRESFHRSLIELLARLGHSDQAIAQYRSCQQVLAQELGVEPMPETQRIHQQILQGQAHNGKSFLTAGRLGLSRSPAS